MVQEVKVGGPKSPNPDDEEDADIDPVTGEPQPDEINGPVE